MREVECRKRQAKSKIAESWGLRYMKSYLIYYYRHVTSDVMLPYHKGVPVIYCYAMR